MSKNDDDIVKIWCYGKWETTPREQAKKFYLECMYSSEGAERDRYTNIYLDLMEGKTICIDDEDEYLRGY